MSSQLRAALAAADSPAPLKPPDAENTTGGLEEGSEDDRPQLPEVPDRCGPQTIPLSVLLDFAIQHVYHEITVSAEVLQRKSESDQEKKIELVKFAHSTRNQFVKLLALVKWIKMSKKLDVCNSINYLLELQSHYYIDAADRLVAMTRGDLVLARLPEYQILPAIDVLTLGTYHRMPTKIKDAFIPPSKITAREQNVVLARLNQLIETRLSRASTGLSPRFEHIVVMNGMAILTVPGEFEVKMTLLGETEKTKWTLLNIKILVEDYELGLGMPLVHPIQVNQLHAVLQTRMDASKNPINEIFIFLHNFCVSLQLDVLFCQTSRLAAGRLRDNITIEKYDPKERCLIVGYWVKRSKSRKVTLGAPKSEAQYRLQIFEDKEDKISGLKVRHFPHAPHLGKLDCRTGRLSMDRLLSETYVVRCRERLLRLRRIIETADPKLKISLTGCAMPSLSMALLNDSTPDEFLVVSVNSFCGKVICSIHRIIENTEDVTEFGRALYSNCSLETIRKFLKKLRIAIIIERYRRSIKSQPVREKTEKEMTSFLKKMPESLPEHRMYLQFMRSSTHYLLVTFVPHPTEIVTIELYLLQNEENRTQMLRIDNQVHLFSKPIREALCVGSLSTREKNSKAGREQRLAFAISAIEDRLTYMFIADELVKRGMEVDMKSDENHVPGGLTLHITDCSKVVPTDVVEFFKCCVRTCIRMDNRMRNSFQFEMCFENIPLVRDVPYGLPHRRIGEKNTTWIQEISLVQGSSATLTPDKVVDNIIHRLARYLKMYKVTHAFSVAYHAHYHKLCSIEAYTFHKLVISYGEQRDQLLILAFDPTEGFRINFGQTMPHREFNSAEIDWHKKPRWNPHSMIANSLKERLKATDDLVWVVNYVIETMKPMQSLGMFSRIRFLSHKVAAQLLNQDIFFPYRLKYHLSAIDETTIRLQYANIVLEFKMLAEAKVAIRDCSRYRPKCAGIHQIFKILSNGQSTTLEDEKEVPASDNPHFAGTPPFLPDPYLVLPPSCVDLQQENMRTSTKPVVIPHDVLMLATDFKDYDGRMTCPLDDYLSAITYLLDIRVSLDLLTHPPAPNLTPTATYSGSITYLDIQANVIKFRATQLDGQGPNTTNMVYYTLYISPINGSCKCAVEFDEGSNPAATPENLQIFSQYFEKVVLLSRNETAIQTFILLTRLTAHGATSSIANVMSAQMVRHLFWVVNC
ncbi:unnamed protein product [Caenorhabditis angaria]|uniref:Mediator of RNA polymerase II transcription subunit 14 n=1 Tax=Caenorhabditis angaria TaxID=860376 RepID=A0A9P1IHK7_9PELO|nr:unnamed protein product [Caenorhabditis angaria]